MVDRKTLKRRDFLRMAGAGMAGAMLAACAPTPATAPEATEAPGKEAPSQAETEVELEVWDSDTNADTERWYEETFVPAFETDHPGVKVKVVYTPWGQALSEKKLTAFAAGQAPDIFMSGAEFVAEEACRKTKIPIDDLLDDWGQREDFFESCLATCTFRGQTYGLPILSAPRAICYHRSLFEEAGIEPADGPWTWDQLKEYALALTERDENGVLVRMGFPTTYVYYQFWLTLNQNGVEVLTEDLRSAAFNNDKGVETIEWWKGCLNAIAAPGTTMPESPIPLFAAQMQAITRANQIAAVKQVRQHAPDLLEQVVVIPDTKREQSLAYVFNDWLGISTQCEHVDLAWEYLTFFLSEEQLSAYNETTLFIPPRKSVAEKAEWMKEIPQLQTFVDIMHNWAAVRKPKPEFRKLRNATDPELEAFFRDKKTASQAMDAMAKSYDEICSEAMDTCEA